MKRPSLKLRITGWFALMMFVIEALVLAFLLAVNGTVATNDPEARLVRMVEHNANRVKYNNRQFRFSRIHYNSSGVYTVLYDADGNVLQGTFPAEFTPAQPLPLGSETVRLVDCGDNEYYVYDVHVDMMVGSVWLRGVINADANGGVMRVILPLAWSLLPVLLVLSVIGGYFIASRALRPVRQLTATANAISDGQDLKARIGLPHTSGSDEIYQLSASFDNMFDRLERSFEAEQRFTSDASHELRTPTTVILAACEDARKNAQTPADYQAALDVIDRQAHKMSALIRSMLEITRLDQGTQKVNWEYADLSDLVTVICDEQAMVARRGIRISCAAEPGIFIDMDVFLISRVVQNLLDNAFKFGVDGGWIHVALRRTAAGAELTVQDNGIGISQENLDKIWQRFYQADPSRQENAGLGLGLSMVPRGVLRKGFIEFRAIITRLIETIIIPLLPLHIFGIFLNLTYTGEAASIIRTLLRVVVVVLVLEVVILLTQFCFAGVVARRNPIKALLTMMPAYLTALGTSSSAATIPVTLRQTKKNGVSDAVASFTIPLCATIHLAGSTSKIFSFAFAIVLTQGLTVSTLQWVGFIFMLGITMVAAPGVPGGAIMAATGLLSSMLGFDDAQVALMIATYIALDSFGTATNVTGDGAIALIIDRMAHGSIGNEGDPENARELAFDGMAYLDRVSVEGVVSPEDLADSAARNGAEVSA